jgi:undecaprenyl-diphosphatase
MEPIRKIFVSLIIYGFFLIFLVLFLNNIISFDVYFFFAINNLANPYLLLFFNLITYLGSSIFWILLIILSWLKKEKKLSLHLFYAFILDTVSLLVLKNLFLRPRPLEAIQNIEFEGPSFPSGHSERAFSGAVVLANYYKKYRILFYILAILVSFSRIYIGLHYPIDVVIGSINGIILSMVALALPTKRILKKH